MNSDFGFGNGLANGLANSFGTGFETNSFDGRTFYWATKESALSDLKYRYRYLYYYVLFLCIRGIRFYFEPLSRRA